MLSSSVYNPSSWSPGTRTGDQRLDQSVDHDKFLTNYSNMYGFWKPAFMQQLNYPTTFHARRNPYKSKRGPHSAPITLLALRIFNWHWQEKGADKPHTQLSLFQSLEVAPVNAKKSAKSEGQSSMHQRQHENFLPINRVIPVLLKNLQIPLKWLHF